MSERNYKRLSAAQRGVGRRQAFVRPSGGTMLALKQHLPAVVVTWPRQLADRALRGRELTLESAACRFKLNVEESRKGRKPRPALMLNN